MSLQAISPPLDAVPASVRRELRLAVPFGIAVVQAINAVGMYQLADAIGWHWPLPFLMPASMIVFDVMSTRMWFKTPKSRGGLRRLAMINAFVGMGLTYVLNAAWHAIERGDLKVDLPLTLAVTAVPTIVGAMLMMMEAMSSERKLSSPAEIPALPEAVPTEVPVELEAPVQVPSTIAPPVLPEVPITPEVPIAPEAPPEPEVEKPEPRKALRPAPNPEDGEPKYRPTLTLAIMELEEAFLEDRKAPSGMDLHKKYGPPSDKAWRNALAEAREILKLDAA